jgi:lipoyl(octanoyl) transferase
VARHRLIIDGPAPGAWNMAVDEALLADAADSGVATLRFYQWSEPTLSLGYFQSIENRYQHAASVGCACVRRQTGGGAILHDRELTYSLVLPAGHELARQTEAIYNSVHDAFIDVLRPIIRSDSKWKAMRRDQESSRAPSEEPFLCFQRRARGDVVLAGSSEETELRRFAGHSDGDWKILGSAQRRHRGAVLQHGSLLLAASPAAPELPGIADLTGVILTPDQLASATAERAASGLGLELAPMELSNDLQSIAAQIANTKYGAGPWTNRR